MIIDYYGVVCMNDYKNFSYYFDEILSSIDYNDWINFTKNFISKTDTILDLACGTGTFAICLKLFGYNVEGLDLSESMIEVAKEKTKMNHLLIDYYIDDMTSFKINKQFKVITCFFDSINHLPTLIDVKNMINRVHEHLDKDGLFLFDIFSYFQFKNSSMHLKDTSLSCEYIWDIKTYDPNILEHTITITDEEKVIKEQYNEYYYSLNDIIDDRFEIVKISGDFLEDYDDESGRLIVVLKKR